MIVLKFGGTSVGSAESINSALDIAYNQISRSPVIVSSAMSGITNRLVEIAEFSGTDHSDKALKLLKEIEDIHNTTAKSFLTNGCLEEALTRLGEIYLHLRSLITGLSLLQECTPKSYDTILSFGEKMSTILLYSRAKERGISVELLNSEDFIITDDNYNEAAPLIEETNKAIKSHIIHQEGKLLITQGFIGSTKEGHTSTLGRGGSDFTATIIGAALKAEEVQIWTDVDGILTTDPRIVSEAKRIKDITYEEAAELAYFGAKVVHPSTIQPAVDAGIPVHVKNTHNPTNPGTRIYSESKETGLRAISLKKNITVVQITSSRMLNAYGFLSKIFEIFNRYQIPVDLIATSEVSVSLTIVKTERLDELIEDLEKIGRIEVEGKHCIVCLVGLRLWKDSTFISKTFDALGSIPIKLVSLGASETNLSIVVPEEKGKETVQILHKTLFGNL